MILVIGGTGRLGRLVVDGLRQRGHAVRVLARHASSAEPPMPLGVDLVDGDVRDAEAVARAASGATCLVVASHGVESRQRDGLATVDESGVRAVATAADAIGASVVLVSVVGASPDSSLPVARTKWSAEHVLRQSDVPWVIVRSAPYAQTWAMILSMTAGRAGRPAIIGPGDTPHRFVDVRDVADVVVRAAVQARESRVVLQVEGPDAVTLNQLAAMLQESQGWRGRPRHLPLPAARMIAAVLGVVRADLAMRVKIAMALNDPDVAGDAVAPSPGVAQPRTVADAIPRTRLTLT